jgi:hypothetical protein
MARNWLFRSAAIATLMIAVAVACSPFAADDAGGTDAGASDATGETNDTDAASDGGRRPCPTGAPSAAHFCDDFDHAGRVDLAWDESHFSDGGRIEETGAAQSPPRAAVLRVAPGDGKAAGYAYLVDKRGAKLDVSSMKRFAASFSVRVDEAPYAAGGSGYAHFAVVEFDAPTCVTSGDTKQREIELTLPPSGPIYFEAKGLRDVCADGGDYVSVIGPYDATHYAPGTGFHRFTIEVSKDSCPSTTGASLRVAVDGAAFPCQPLGAGAPFSHGTNLLLRLGLFIGGGPWGETALTYDDVTFDFE